MTKPLLFVFFFICFLLSEAQYREPNKVYFIGGVGAMKNDIFGESWFVQNKAGLELDLPVKFSTELLFRWEVNSFLFFEPGIRIMTREFKTRPGSHLKAEYLNVPLSLGLKTPIDWTNHFSIFVTAGGYYNIVANDSSEGSVYPIEPQNNFGILASTGLEIPINKVLKIVGGYRMYEDKTQANKHGDKFSFRSQEVFLEFHFLLSN